MAPLLIVVAVAMIPAPAAAQYTESTYFETWTDFRTIYNFSSRFRYDGDYAFRAALSTADFTQVAIRPAARFEVEPWLRLHGGVGWFHTFFRNAEDVDELRPWLGIRVPWPRFGGWVVSNYFRLELRAFNFRTGGDWDVVWRARYQLQVRSPDFTIGSAQGFYALAFVEPFHNFGSFLEGISVDRVRLNAGAGKNMAGGWRVELNAMFQKGRVREGSGGFDLDEFILRLRLFYSFN